MINRTEPLAVMGQMALFLFLKRYLHKFLTVWT